MKSNELVSRGHFWLEDSDAPLAGELKYSPQGGAGLYLFGALEELQFQNQGIPIRYPIIRGQTESLV